MKRKLKFAKKFAKKQKKLIYENQCLKPRIQKTLLALCIDPFYKSLRTHKIQIADGYVYSSRVTGDIRIIWEFENSELSILLLDIGGHEGSKGVYK